MYELRTLGSTDLRAADGTAVSSVLAQPKRLALLVYLALAGRDAPVRRDTLLGLFWPESDDERGRAALRQAVRYLRRSLGDAAIVGLGDDGLGIAPGAVRCDAVELRSALAAGDHRRALELYAGELLPGFHADEAPEFERWLAVERAALHEAVACAAGVLAEQAADRGDLAEALERARQAAALLPLDERVLRRQLMLLERAGDRAGAVAAYRAFAQRMAAELETEPAPETRALVERIRHSEDPAARPARDRAGGAENSPDLSVAEASGGGEPRGESPAAAELAVGGRSGSAAAAGGADRSSGVAVSVPRRRARVPAAAALALVLLVLAVGFVYAARTRGHSAELVATRVLVATFENQTAEPALAAVGRMAADWIIDGVARTGRFEVVPSTALWATERHLADGADAAGGAARYRRLAQETGAGLVVAGSFYREGDRLLFRAQLLDAASGRVLRPIEGADAHLDSLVQGIDRLRGRVLAALAPVGDTVYHLRFVAPPPTYDAYREYLAGMERFVSSDPAGALPHYERAAAADPAYPMPQLAAAIMHMNLGDFAAADSVAADVLALRDRLGPLEHSTLDFVLALLRGDRPAAYDAMVRAAAIAPGTINEHMVGELARDMNRPREALRVLQALGPERGELRGWRMHWREVGYANHMLGDHRRELREARSGRRLHPNDPFVLSLEVQALAALGRVADIDRRIEERLANMSPDWPSAGELMALAARELGAHGHRAAADRLFERSLAWYAALPGPARQAPATRFAHATVLRHAGMPAEARDLLDALVAEHPEDLTYLAGLGVTLARLGERDAAERISSRLAQWEPPIGRAGPINRRWGSFEYARAAIAAHLGRPAEAVELLRRAQAQGFRMGPYVHSDPDLGPLRTHPGFREWLRPRG
jgi:DNA-binding SARP family transcriptional activator/TolB-like protein